MQVFKEVFGIIRLGYRREVIAPIILDHVNRTTIYPIVDVNQGALLYPNINVEVEIGEIASKSQETLIRNAYFNAQGYIPLRLYFEYINIDFVYKDNGVYYCFDPDENIYYTETEDNLGVFYPVFGQNKVTKVIVDKTNKVMNVVYL